MWLIASMGTVEPFGEGAQIMTTVLWAISGLLHLYCFPPEIEQKDLDLKTEVFAAAYSTPPYM